jgi:hypothetical protein
VTFAVRLVPYIYESALANFCQRFCAKQKSQNPSPLHGLLTTAQTRPLAIRQRVFFCHGTIAASTTL